MDRTYFEESLEARADLFKALGHPARLLILNLIETRPRHGEELAAILRLKPATISYHLAKLAGVGLLRSRKDQYYQTYSLVKDMFKRALGEIILMPQPGLAAQVEEDTYRNRVLKAFFRHGRLIRIPAQLKKRRIILMRLIKEFEPEREYSELEVNRILVEFHEDVATLRREMVDQRLMKRQRGIYRRTSDQLAR
jgi:ArsR family transcriptional regulator